MLIELRSWILHMTDSISRCLQVHKVCEAGQAIGKGTTEGVAKQKSGGNHCELS